MSETSGAGRREEEAQVHDITIRQMAFPFPDQMDPMIIPGEPEESYGIVALSLLLPYLEPYLIRTMKEARKHVTDPALRADLEAFSGQEGQHYRQHIRFNDAIRGFGFPKLAEFEAELDADYRRFSDTKPLRWNLAYAEGFEALTTAVARASFEMGTHPDMNPLVRDLLSWHLVEELEHRTVAFDIYDHICGSYFYRLVVGSYAQWHMGRWIVRVARTLYASDERTRTEAGDVAARRARSRERARRTRKSLLPKLLKTYLPWYTPHRIELSPEVREMAEAYSRMAVRTS